jgi:hypothetical protein
MEARWGVLVVGHEDSIINPPLSNNFNPRHSKIGKKEEKKERSK